MGGMPFWRAWAPGALFKALWMRFGIRSAHDAAGGRGRGKNLSVDARSAKQELDWESRVFQDAAMARIKASKGETCFLSAKKRGKKDD